MALDRGGVRRRAGRDALPAADEKRDAVRRMFDRIAPSYDRLNRVMSLGLDQRWRRIALDRLAIRPGDRLLDLACGTGDLAEAAAARGARVIGLDFAAGMLHGARRRRVPAAFARGDAAALPVADAGVRHVACGFALRNFVDLKPVFEELARVVEDGGRVALLDVDRPRGRALGAAHSLYFDRIVPRIGGWLSDREAYAYLPQSTAYLPPPAELASLLAASGFEAVRHETLLFGAVQLLTGTRGPRR